MHMLDVAQVEIVEADRNYVRLTIGREVFHARSTLQQAERSFQTQPMLRISRSCLVNMSHVKEVSRTPRGDFILVVAGGTTVTSSEGFRGVLTAINLVNYLDRYVVSAIAPSLKSALALNDTQLGWLMPAFLLVYMVAARPCELL